MVVTMRDPQERVNELLETVNRYLERARTAEAERDQWRNLATADVEALQAIGEEFGFLGGENRIDAVRRVLTEQRDARDEARQVVRDIYWMALRYADGRRSYAVGMVNDAVRKGYDGGWLDEKAAGGDSITPRFARDGMNTDGEDF